VDRQSPALVTGGTGFLGRHIVARLLAQGRPVTVLARRRAPDLEAQGVRFVCTSLEDSEAVMKACQGMETIFHTAAKVGVWGNYEPYFRSNVLGTRAILAGCKRHGVRRLVYTSTPSVVYQGTDLAGADESLPLTTACPCAYPLTKAIAEREVLEANRPDFFTTALRPHLIWGPGDPHLVPRVLEKAQSGRLRIVGQGRNRVDMVHVENAADAQLLAETALEQGPARGKAYFITNDEPVVLWDWINHLLVSLGIEAVTRRVPLGIARAAGLSCELAWKWLPLGGEPPMTRFVASELAKDHWFSLQAAKRDLQYTPRIRMNPGTEALIAHLRRNPTPAPQA
jgi:nucleoside-diphosphate-sugar epimerase